MSNDSSTIEKKSLHDFYQTALDATSEEMGARFRHVYEVNVALKNENLRLRESVDALLAETKSLRYLNDQLSKKNEEFGNDNRVFKKLIETLVGRN